MILVSFMEILPVPSVMDGNAAGFFLCVKKVSETKII